MATLFIASGPAEGRWFRVKARTLVVGRDEGLIAQVVGEGVSRKHMQLSHDEARNGYYVLDLQSKNGVFINGQRIAGETRLAGEELIRIGEVLLYFTLADFDDDNNALQFYRQRGERAKPTISISGSDLSA